MSSDVERTALHLTVRVTGTIRGTNIDRGAEADLQADALVLAWHEAGPWRVSLSGVDGVETMARECTVHLADGDTLVLTGDTRIVEFARQLELRACSVPELTRGLRVFGVRRGRAAVDGAGLHDEAANLSHASAHDRWFAPLIAARRALEDATSIDARLQAMDAEALSRSMQQAMLEMAALHAPGDAAEARAVHAILDEEAAILFGALDRLSSTANELRASADATRVATWRAWIDALRRVFAAADAVWAEVRDDL